MIFDDDENDIAPVLPDEDSQSPPLQPPQAAPAMPVDDSMNPLVKNYLAQKYNLGNYNPQARQDLVADAQPDIGDRATAALAAIGAGFQGQNSAAAGASALNQARTQKRQKVEDFDKSRAAALEYETEDPDSDTSKRFRATLKANFPKIAEQYGDGFDKLTAADQKSVFQVAETKAKLDEAGAKRASVNAFKESQAADRADRAADKRQLQISAQDDKDAKALEKTLGAGWAGRSGQAGQVQAKINAAESAEALIQQAKTQDGGLDARQIEELAQSTGKLIGGGGAQASARIDALVPHTFWGKAQTMKEYLANKPQGAEMQAFTDRLADTVKREKDLAQTQMRQYQIESLGGHARLKKSNPDLYDDILQKHGIDNSMIDQKGQYKAPKVPIGTQTNSKTGEKRIKYSDGSFGPVEGDNTLASGE